MVENITEYKLDLLKDFIKFSIRKNRIITLVCSCIILICALIELLFKEWVMGSVFLLLGITFMFLGIFLVGISLKRAINMPNTKNEYKFLPDKVEITTFSNGKQVGNTTLPYTSIVKVVENNSNLYLYISNVQALIVNINNFKDKNDKELVKAYINNAKTHCQIK